MQIGTRIIFLTASAAVLCAFQAASAADTNAATTATLGNPVIARGTGLEITRGDLDDAMTGIKMQTQAPMGVDRRAPHRRELRALPPAGRLRRHTLHPGGNRPPRPLQPAGEDRKSTRLNSSHLG